ncbi:MAG: acyl-CoA dehydrogenase family protein [Candidatus Aminicenantaceae bacterium]
MENFIQFNDILNDEEILIRKSIREFVDNEFLPIITEYHRKGKFPEKIIPRLAELGVFGATLSEYELPGLSAVPYGLIMLELERGDSGLRSVASVQNSLVIYPIHQWGSKEQKNHWIPRFSSGELIGCYGLTEADFGSNPGSMRTKVKKSGKGYILNGSKAWITNGSMAQIAVVWAKDEKENIRGVLVEEGMPGFETKEYKGKYSLRASDTSELFFSDVFIDEEHILPGTSSLKHPFMCLTEARFGIAWGAIGSAIAVSEYALDYAKSRLQFRGKPIATHQIIQEKLVWMLTEISKSQLLVHHLSRLKDKGKLNFSQVSMAKRNNVWMARECARLAREILGAAGIVDEHPVIRHMMNMESVYTYEGSHDMHTLIVGQALTGYPAFNPPEE